MNVVVRGLALVVLCGLAIALPTRSLGPLSAPGFALAAEDNAGTGNETAAGDRAEDEAGREGAKEGEADAPGDIPDDAGAEESEEIFVPSEDISEDNDVPFPVDI